MDINTILESHKISVSQEYTEEEVMTILREKKENLDKEEILHKIFSCIDLTTLNPSDSRSSINSFIEKVNHVYEEYDQLPPIASVCIYPRFLNMARKKLNVEHISIAAVSGGFPSSQTFTEIKVAECLMAVKEGADELDVVISIGDILDGNYQKAYEEIKEIRQAIGEKTILKVILETGELKSLTNVKIASIIAIKAGADFIKTSTGKVPTNATLEATLVMCETIKKHYDETGVFVGFKAAGGIVTVNDSIEYTTIFSHTLGEENITKEHFRIGASRLANNLTKEIFLRKEIPYKTPLF